MQASLTGKASVAEVEARVDREELDRQLQRRPERAEVERARAEGAEQARAARAALDARAERLERRVESLDEEA